MIFYVNKTKLKGTLALDNLRKGLKEGRWDYSQEDFKIMIALACAAAENKCKIEEVLTRMLSKEDMDDLKSGLIKQEELNDHVKVWVKMKKPNQNGA